MLFVTAFLLDYCKSVHTKYLDKCVWLHSNKTLLTKINDEPNLASGFSFPYCFYHTATKQVSASV